nr:MAG TPA: hypothetical protein [Bacteriophage sp.]
MRTGTTLSAFICLTGQNSTLVLSVAFRGCNSAAV